MFELRRTVATEEKKTTADKNWIESVLRVEFRMKLGANRAA